MTREIMYRIWSKALNRMIYDPYIGAERDQVNDLFNGKLNKFIWMQYTGLTDKNGRGIYEGDIVKLELKHYELFESVPKKSFDTQTVLGKIYYADEHGGFALEWHDEYCEFTLERHRLLEVIGNIYENPELIKC